ncbi:MAG: bifunctional glutamate N-acetyltransferase/amino-acid acetyltransferase ArgJ [Pseudomonadota bacterium]
MDDLPVSPLAPASLPNAAPMDGVRLAVAETGVKYSGRPDLLLMTFDPPASVAGVFTKSLCPSAPVDWCRTALGDGNGTAYAVLVNAGNANAFTGRAGAEAVAETMRAVAEATGAPLTQILAASTGVIGEPLAASSLTDHLPALLADGGEATWEQAARAILTTDTYPKLAVQETRIGGRTITVTGIAKGSGMIAPDMATMLSFVTTDMPVAPALLQQMVSELADISFNAITVDSDTSTSDSVMVFATGAAGGEMLTSREDERFGEFFDLLGSVLHALAMLVVRDGEGATKQIEVSVSGASDDVSAKKIALSIANSPLVKTAVAGEDANWGRVVMAIGKAGEPADRDKISIRFGNVEVAKDGQRVEGYSEDAASAVMRLPEITIGVDVGVGLGNARVWTCDLTKQYVAINGDYRS